MSPVLVQTDMFQITIYSVLTTIAFLIASFLIWRDMRRTHFTKDEAFDLLFVTVFGTLIGARLFFVLTHFDQFGLNILSWFAILSRVGFSVYGGVFGAVITVWYFSKQKKWNAWEIGDKVVVPAVIAEMFEAVGCFFSGCRYGVPTELPIGVEFVGVYGPRHPTQLYYTGAFLIFLVLLFFLRRRVRPDGFFVVLYFFGWGLIHTIIAFFEEVVVYWGSVTLRQLLSLSLLIVAVILFWRRYPQIVKDMKYTLQSSKIASSFAKRIKREKHDQ